MDPQSSSDDQAPPLSPNITAVSLAGPLEQYMLPHLTADALAAFAISCKALHQLIIAAPSSLLQPNLQTLLPPAIRHKALDKRSLDALLDSQAAFQQSIQAGASAQLQRLTLPDRQHADKPCWALESPCKTVIVDCRYHEFDHHQRHQMALDPGTLTCSHQHPAAKWLKPHSRCWYIQSLLKEGALMRNGTQLGLLDLGTLELSGPWEGPHHCAGCSTWTGAGLVFHEHAKLRSVDNWSHSVVSLIALDPSSMQEVYTIGPPHKPSAGRRLPDTSAYWIKLSPDQQHLAILWFEDSAAHFCSTRFLKLCIYTACTGQQVAAFDVAAIFEDLECRRTPTSVAQWARDSSGVLYHEDQENGPSDKSLRVLVAEISGSHMSLSSLPSFKSQAVQWSADGRCVSLCGFFISGAEIQGSVWHVPTGRKVLSWANADRACLPIWSPFGCTIFCSASKSVVSLFAIGCPEEANHQSYHGPHLLQREDPEFQGPTITYSPSGQVFVATWQLEPSRLADMHPVIHHNEELPRKLGHAICNPTAAACTMVPVATSSSGWLTGSINWHPCPRTAHIYAITTASGSVYLMDVKQHRCIRKWTRLELAGPPCGWSDLPFRLSWSPDGTQLLVLGSGCICVLNFVAEPSSTLPASC